jgi:hypothetical protein
MARALLFKKKGKAAVPKKTTIMKNRQSCTGSVGRGRHKAPPIGKVSQKK